MEAFIGLLRNAEKVNSSDVELYMRNHEGLMIKLQKLDPKAIRNEVLDRHFETLKSIQKYFIDSTIEGFKERSEYAPFLAWG